MTLLLKLFLELFFYMMVSAAGIVMLLLLLAGHWLGIFFLVITILAFALAIIIGIGQAQGRPWAHRLARLLFMR